MTYLQKLLRPPIQPWNHKYHHRSNHRRQHRTKRQGQWCWLPQGHPLLQDLHILDLYGLNITRPITLSLKLLERPWNIIAFYTFSCDMRPECLKYYRTLNIYFLIWLICWCCLPFHLVLHFLMEGRDIRLLNNSLVSQCMLRHLAMSEYHPGCLEHARLSYLANNILKYRGHVSLDGGVLGRFQW